MDKGKSISISFDDGHMDNMRVVKEILLPMNIPATFNTTSGFIEGREIDIPMRKELVL